MAVYEALVFVWVLFKDWLMLFAAPYTNPRMLWVILPVMFSWFFVEFYQEKKGTSLGNAISNGVMLLWVGVDWGRITVNSISGKISYALVVSKLAMSALFVFYGVYIIVAGARAKGITKVLGRIRVVTYFILVLSPLFYGVISVSWQFFLAIIIFFPLFYYSVELVDRLIPDPSIFEHEKSAEKSLEDFGQDFNSQDNSRWMGSYSNLRRKY
ncbi:hypothetical protein HY638_04320 [Candidatus Woesearchaeota archaeon]|nr:hypothetical protein [Candidatus Woesearchaeota archaeon]